MVKVPSRVAPRRIGFIVDHPKRDQAGGAMLAHALGNRGVETALIPLYDQAVDIPLLGLDALVVNFARPVNLELIKGYRELGIPVWVLDTEGGILADDGANSPDRLAAYVRDSGYANLLSGYFFWGSTLHDAFQRLSGIPADRLHLTGCPRFDFAAPRWREILEHERDGYVLVNANFPLVNPLFARSPEDELKTLVAAGWKPEYVQQMIVDLKLILEGFLATVARLATALTEHRFLVRPHPFENPVRYQEAFKHLPNVEVDAKGSVLNVIQHSRCLLHLNCGTSVEAILLDKLPLSMEFLNTSHMSQHSSLPSLVSQAVNSEAALIDCLRALPEATRAFDFQKRHQTMIEPWFHLNDGLAAERIANTLTRAIAHRPRVSPSLRGSLASARSKSTAAQRLQALVANILGSSVTSRLRAKAQPSRRVKQLDPDLLEALLQRIARHQGTRACHVTPARHPYTGARLASILVTPA